jgi:TolB-like protein
VGILALSPGTGESEGEADPTEPIPGALDIQPTKNGTSALWLNYPRFVAALRDALRDFHRHDLLARNPLMRAGFGKLNGSADPQHLKELLTKTVGMLFGHPCDEKLRRVIELTYFQPGPKQEAIAERLSLPFGTYRRHLTTARDRLARWLWDNWQAATQPGAPRPTVKGETPEGATTTSPETGAPAAPRLSLVVLPFVNIGGNAQDDAFVDGITETLTTDLSRSSGVFAISRSTAFAYKGKPMDIRLIGRELGVRYVLEGSVQCAGERLRINAQLVDAESGVHLWAERFDKQRTDLLDMQDEVTTRLARAVHIALIAAESRRAADGHPGRLDAVDYTLRGLAAWNQPLSIEAARQARHFFAAALRLDGHNIAALLGFANAHMWEVRSYASVDRAGQIRAAEAAVRKALELAPDSADARVTYGTVLYPMRAPERALREFQLAIDLDSNLAVAHAFLGNIKFVLGRADETSGHVKEAMRLSPRDPLLFYWYFLIGTADVYLGQTVRGVESLRKSVEIYPNWPHAQFALAGALPLVGLLAEADEVCATARCLAPNFTVAKFRNEAKSDNPVYLAQREYLYQGMRLAGVPES